MPFALRRCVLSVAAAAHAALSLQRAVAILRRGAALSQRAVALLQRGVALLQRTVALLQRGVALLQRGVALLRRGAALLRRGVAPSRGAPATAVQRGPGQDRLSDQRCVQQADAEVAAVRLIGDVPASAERGHFLSDHFGLAFEVQRVANICARMRLCACMYGCLSVWYYACLHL